MHLKVGFTRDYHFDFLFPLDDFVVLGCSLFEMLGALHHQHQKRVRLLHVLLQLLHIFVRYRQDLLVLLGSSQ